MKKMNHAEYQKKLRKVSVEALHYTIKDANEASQANHENENCGYYQDEVIYARAELARRAKVETAARERKVKKVKPTRLDGYEIGKRIFYKSYEGIKGNGNGIIVDKWTNAKGETYVTVRGNTGQVVCLSGGDVRDAEPKEFLWKAEGK